LSIPHNCFDGPNEIIFRFVSGSDVAKLDVAKFIDTSIKSFFPCNITICHVITLRLLYCYRQFHKPLPERYRNFRERRVKFILKDSSRRGRVIKALNIRARKSVPQSERALARGDNSRELIKRCINNRGWRASYRKRKRKGTRRRRARLSPPSSRGRRKIADRRGSLSNVERCVVMRNCNVHPKKDINYTSKWRRVALRARA